MIPVAICQRYAVLGRRLDWIIHAHVDAAVSFWIGQLDKGEHGLTLLLGSGQGSESAVEVLDGVGIEAHLARVSRG